MRNTILAVTAIVLVAGCDATDLPVMDVDDMQLAIVSGDGQVGQVQEASSSIRTAAVGPDKVLPDTLVARIEDKSGSNANLPANTVVNYHVPTDGCGEPWSGTALPNDSATVWELWTRPAGLLPNLDWHDVDGVQTWGSLCTLEARTVVDNTFATDTVFRAVFTPGPMAVHDYRAPNDANGTPELVLANPVEDDYGNPLPYVMAVVCDQAECGAVAGTMADFPNVRRQFDPVEGATGVLHLIAQAADTFATGDFYTFKPDSVNYPDLYRLRVDWR